MVTHTGKNLSVIIATKADQNWQAFATWYSLSKNLPDASVRIICARNNSTPFQYFQWAKRLSIPVTHYTPLDPANSTASRLEILRRLPDIRILVIDSTVMAIDTLDESLLQRMEKEDKIFDSDAWFLKNYNLTELMDDYMLEGTGINIEENVLCSDVKTAENPRALVSCRKGCGKWIDTLKGCPFSNVNGLTTTEMNASENRVFDLWRQMCYLYSVVN
jgi:hypothetical protein